MLFMCKFLLFNMSVCENNEQEMDRVSQVEKKCRVLVLYTGGTIGMKWTEKGYVPAKDYFNDKVRTYPMLHDSQYKLTDSEIHELNPLRPIALPLTMNKHRIIYCIQEYDPLLDSSNMSMSDWARIATDISKWYSKFDSFIVLHGTDTMAYTASALSFMLENLGKTVILTGSQIPLSELRNDGRDNFLEALIIAGEYIIPEVTLYFNNRLYRGNRTVKLNSGQLDPFSSPNIPPLATVGVEIEIVWDALFRPTTIEKFRVHSDMNTNVGILRIFPGISQTAVHSFLQSPMEGVVLQSYGSGNIPDIRDDIIKELKNASERGVVIVNCTQCLTGHVTEKYAAGRILKDIGVIPGHDMTPEAALTKLSYLLGKRDLTLEERRQLMEKNMRGELTVFEERNVSQLSFLETELLQSVAKTLHISSSKGVKLLRETLFPPLMCAAAAKGDLERLKKLQQEGGDFSLPDYVGLTPLHLAARGGKVEVVHYLLQHGASVHMKDTFNHTPLYAAIMFKHLEVIELLVKTGAHIQESSIEIGTKLCQAAAKNDIESLKAWNLAGADLNTKDYANRTALSLAKENGHCEVVQFISEAIGLNTIKEDSKESQGAQEKCEGKSNSKSYHERRDSSGQLCTLNLPSVKSDN